MGLLQEGREGYDSTREYYESLLASEGERCLAPLMQGIKEMLTGAEFGSGTLLAAGDMATYLLKYAILYDNDEQNTYLRMDPLLPQEEQLPFALPIVIETVHKYDLPFAETLRTRSQEVIGYQQAWRTITPLVDTGVKELTTAIQNKGNELPGSMHTQKASHRLVGSILTGLVNASQNPVQNR